MQVGDMLFFASQNWYIYLVTEEVLAVKFKRYVPIHMKVSRADV